MVKKLRKTGVHQNIPWTSTNNNLKNLHAFDNNKNKIHQSHIVCVCALFYKYILIIYNNIK